MEKERLSQHHDFVRDKTFQWSRSFLCVRRDLDCGLFEREDLDFGLFERGDLDFGRIAGRPQVGEWAKWASRFLAHLPKTRDREKSLYKSYTFLREVG